MNFEVELEHVERGLERRRQTLASITPDQPHPTCPCERTWAVHLREEIDGLTALKEAMQGDYSRLMAQMQENGAGQVQYILSHVFDPRTMSPEEIMRRLQPLSLKLLRGSVPFARLLQLLVDREKNPQFDPRLN